MRLPQKKIEAILALPGPKRYSHFIKVVADQRKTWGLFSDGWALAETDNGQPVFPLWPAIDYANLCARDRWADFKPREIDFDTLLEVLIPKLKTTNTLLGVFPLPNEKGLTPDYTQFESDLRSELAKIE